MRASASCILAGLIFSSAALAADETPVTTQKTVAPTLTAIQPKNPAAAAPGGPIIQSIGARLPPQILGTIPEVLLIDLHFSAPNGDAAILHRDLVQSSGNSIRFTENLPINVPADGQKQGGVITNDWHCNNGQYYVTLRAYVMDGQGNRSNDVQYTVHCNGG
jgi:hypothetical protein